MINWKVRLKNKYFWLSVVPFICVIIARILDYLGYTFTESDLTEVLSNVIELVFYVLIGLGIVNDNTTAGLSDSYNALSYEKPKEYNDTESED